MSSADQSYRCCKCKDYFASVSELEVHLSVDHLGWQPYQCFHCFDQSPSVTTYKGTRAQLIAHVQRAHPTLPPRSIQSFNPENEETLKQWLNDSIASANGNPSKRWQKQEPNVSPRELNVKIETEEDEFAVQLTKRCKLCGVDVFDSPREIRDHVKYHLERKHKIVIVNLLRLDRALVQEFGLFLQKAFPNFIQTEVLETQQQEQEQQQDTQNTDSTGNETEQNGSFGFSVDGDDDKEEEPPESSASNLEETTSKSQSETFQNRPSSPQDEISLHANRASESAAQQKDASLRAESPITKRREVIIDLLDDEPEQQEIGANKKKKKAADKEIKCSLCRTSGRRVNMSKHLYTTHVRRKCIMCPYCPEKDPFAFGTYYNKERVYEHIRKEHKGREERIKDKRGTVKHDYNKFLKICFGIDPLACIEID